MGRSGAAGAGGRGNPGLGPAGTSRPLSRSEVPGREGGLPTALAGWTWGGHRAHAGGRKGVAVGVWGKCGGARGWVCTCHTEAWCAGGGCVAGEGRLEGARFSLGRLGVVGPSQ